MTQKKQSIYSRTRRVERRAERRIVKEKQAVIRAEGEKAKQFFKNALKKDSIESKQARSGRSFVKGVSSSLRGGSGRGLKAIVRLPRVSSGWSDMGLIAGSGFKEYQSRNVFPSSKVSRVLHPQEKAEIDAIIQKNRLFGSNLPLSNDDRLKKKNTEVL